MLKSASAECSTLVLVPAFNAAAHLPELLERLRRYLCNEHLLVINDGSTDASLDILRRYEVNYISFPQNRGKGAALAAGFSYALQKGYRSVLTIDADLQHLPEEIPRFFARDDGRTIVVGTRIISPASMPFERWLTNYLTSLIISIFSTQRVRDSQSGFRLIPATVLRAFRLSTADYDLESELLFKAGGLGLVMDEVAISTVYSGTRSYIDPVTDTLRFIRQIWRRIWM
ncbi:MAG TPA: glycosyltransferase family 2 protein [Acidobacteriota bacterium]|nr:glycosyltransferase family 2 protein [Acidobacteriota bacterium]